MNLGTGMLCTGREVVEDVLQRRQLLILQNRWQKEKEQVQVMLCHLNLLVHLVLNHFRLILWQPGTSPSASWKQEDHISMTSIISTAVVIIRNELVVSPLTRPRIGLLLSSELENALSEAEGPTLRLFSMIPHLDCQGGKSFLAFFLSCRCFSFPSCIPVQILLNKTHNFVLVCGVIPFVILS
ncbi:uncharacterized protein LOC120194145 isoform X1 [Hibiscus syriacus]|uniref:uncharacterized protein LOC120194145 isoform X1 n=1 Tax=Hibiscus syriacus TaxID=106335 RepID=UPI001924FA16|nr:uncharacterized protein LOC120194145 isoform X1 [Hibiscus syriacus]